MHTAPITFYNCAGLSHEDRVKMVRSRIEDIKTEEDCRKLIEDMGGVINPNVTCQEVEDFFIKMFLHDIADVHTSCMMKER